MDSLVPEDFDLDKARGARSTTPDEKRKRCPECESIAIHSTHSSYFKGPKPTARYYCKACEANFDDPIRGIRG